tara:strand:- start:976 stop:1899 length:924 start_codon:yes stop_codon:yes gene_type:complete
LHSERYTKFISRLKTKNLIALDGATGTELQKRGVKMDGSWCGSASLYQDILKKVHIDYIHAGSKIITTNTYASSRIMLKAAGMEKRFEEINQKAINAALYAREETNKNDILIAGSISHRYPIADGDILSQAVVNVSKNELQDSTYEMLNLLSNNGCDLILLEMMYRPERMEVVFDVMRESNIPVWVGFSCRKSDTGEILSLTDERKVTFEEMMSLAKNYEFDVWGAMHTSVDIMGDCIETIKENFNGPIFAYPDSGGWLSPNWTFDNVINPKNFIEKVKVWHSLGAQIIGGCCGTSPDHIKAISSIK